MKSNSDKSSEEEFLLSTLNSSKNLNFHLKIPIKLLEQNATSVNEEDKEYIYNWEYNSKAIDNIYIKAKIYKKKNIVLAVSMAMLVLSSIIAYLYITNRKRN